MSSEWTLSATVARRLPREVAAGSGTDTGTLDLASAADRPGRWAGITGSNLTRVLLPVALLVIWQGLASAGRLNPRVLDSPVAVLQALYEMTESGILQESLIASFLRASEGFAIGASAGLVLGLVAGLSRVGEHAFDALLQMLRMIPFLALIPLFVVWFGVDEAPKVVMISFACVFPMYISTFAGARQVDPKIVEAATVFGMSRLAIATTIIIPLALPTILVGVRYAMGVSLLALVGAEQVNATSGIGYLALSPRAALRTDIVLGIVLIYSLLGIAVDLIIRLLQRVFLPWQKTLVEGIS